MINSISFIVLTQFLHFNELKILRQPGYLFFKLNQQYFFTDVILLSIKEGHNINNRKSSNLILNVPP